MFKKTTKTILNVIVDGLDCVVSRIFLCAEYRPEKLRKERDEAFRIATIKIQAAQAGFDAVKERYLVYKKDLAQVREILNRENKG